MYLMPHFQGVFIFFLYSFLLCVHIFTSENICSILIRGQLFVFLLVFSAVDETGLHMLGKHLIVDHTQPDDTDTCIVC